jgi:transposase
MKANLAVMQALQIQIDAIEKALLTHCRNDPGYRLLNTVSGIGPILATVILLETGSMDRFADVGKYASYCRCVGSTHLSNGKKKGEGNTKNGNRYLAWAYVEAANFAIRYCEAARKFYQRKKAKPMALSRSRQWHTSWRELVFTCSRQEKVFRWSAASHKSWQRSVNQALG